MVQNKLANIDLVRGKEMGPIIAYTPEYVKKSQWQEIRIGKSEAFGKVLVLDGQVQIAERDEHLYHELLVYPGMALTRAKKVLILGGGDGCAAREVLKHPYLERVVLVDIDKDVVEMSKEYFKDVNKGSLEHPKLDVVIGDAKEYIKNTDEKFDLVISDVTDPDVIDIYFYSEEFYKDVKRVLTEGGVFVTQGGAATIEEPTVKKVAEEVSKVFKNVVYAATPHVGSFFSPWGIVIASDYKDVKDFEEVEGVMNRYMNRDVYRGLITTTEAYLREAEPKITYYDAYEIDWEVLENTLKEKGKKLL